MEPVELEQRLHIILAQTSSPYDEVAGGVYLQRAWERGGEFVIEKCVQLLKEASSPKIE